VTTKKKTGNQTLIVWPRTRSKISRNGQKAGLGIPQMFCLFLLASVAGMPLAFAKQKPPATKTISGQVLGASNHGIPGASVLLTDLETHKTDAIYAGSDGRYNFSGLSAYDDYKVQARFQGMTSETREVSSMDPRLQIVVNLTVSPRSQK
jgi:Carboxypeptidase regulatory-like domain